jgi:hypothetical protein
MGREVQPTTPPGAEPTRGMTEEDLQAAARARELEPSQGEVELKYRFVDWHLDSATIEALPPDELKEHLIIVNEQIKRLHDAVVAQAKRLAPLLPKTDVAPLDEETNMVLNPDQYPRTFESREDITED